LGKRAKSSLPNRSGGHLTGELEIRNFQRYATNAATNETAVLTRPNAAVSTQISTAVFQRYATNAATNETDTITGDTVATNEIEPPCPAP